MGVCLLPAFAAILSFKLSVTDSISHSGLRGIFLWVFPSELYSVFATLLFAFRVVLKSLPVVFPDALYVTVAMICYAALHTLLAFVEIPIRHLWVFVKIGFKGLLNKASGAKFGSHLILRGWELTPEG